MPIPLSNRDPQEVLAAEPDIGVVSTARPSTSGDACGVKHLSRRQRRPEPDRQ